MPTDPSPTGGPLPDWVKLAEETAGVGYWHVDVATRALSWSDNLFRLHGLEVADQPDIARAMAMIHPDDRERVSGLLARAMEFGEDYTIQRRMRRADGAWRVIAGRVICERDETGAVATVFGVAMDVTDTQAALQQSEARYRALAESANDLIVQSDLTGRITYLSPSSERVTGYASDELVGESITGMINAEDLARLAPVVMDWFAHPERPAPRIEYRARHKDGRELWLEARPAPLTDAASGQIIGITDVVRDISWRKALEAELVGKCEEAEAATKAKAEFLANMSHEIRTPLTAILGFSGLLGDMAGLPEVAQAHVRRIGAAGEQLLGVVNQVLDFSRLDVGQLQLDLKPLRPADFVTGTVDILGAQAAGKGLTLEARVALDTPAWVLLDAGRTRQVLLNLVGNAVKFTAAGSVKVTLARHGDSQLKITVTDTGPGIEPALQVKLFERFSQVDGSISRDHGGAGLGLAICKGLVELMGGTIGVSSAPGRGSTFWFTLAAPPAAKPGAVVEAVGASPPAPRHILIVDDVAVNRLLVRAMLEPLGYTFEEADSGPEAVAVAALRPFDLILMDLQMAGMDGMQATRLIRSGGGLNRDAPIVALSANVLGVQIADCRAAGMDDHLAKPIVPFDLVSTVARWTQGGGARQPKAAAVS